MPISQWSETPASNATITDATYGNIVESEGMAPNQVNNSARSMMAHVRNFYENIEWRDFGHTVARASDTTFTIGADVTADYVAGRRIKLKDSSTLYGTITASSYSAPNTTVTVDVDGGTALSATLDTGGVELGPDNTNKIIGPHYFTETLSGTTLTVGVQYINGVIGVDTSGAGGAPTANLPAAATAGNGFTVSFYLLDATYALTIDGSGSETINGVASITLNTVSDYVELMCDGSNWKIINDGRRLRGCLAYRTTTVAIGDSTATDVGFPSEKYDTDSAHDVSSQNSRIVIPADVHVINVTASVNFDANGAGRRSAEILLSGASLSPACQTKINSCSATQSEILTLSTGDIKVANPGTDYVELNVLQTSGGNLNVGGSGELTWLCVNFK